MNTDEGIRPGWAELDEAFGRDEIHAHDACCARPERYGVYIGIEPHQSISQTTRGCCASRTLVDSPFLRVNYDTATPSSAARTPTRACAPCRHLLVHVHAKDIAIEHAEAERGKVTGTPVGCACGDGVIDWKKVIGILREPEFQRRPLGRVRHGRTGPPQPRPPQRRPRRLRLSCRRGRRHRG